MNEDITIQYCIDKHEKSGEMTIINDGHVIGFEEENAPTADQSK